MKKLVQQKILYFQGFSAALFLHSRTISRKIFRQIGNGVALDGHGRGIPGEACRRRWINPYGVVHEIGRKGRVTELIVLQIPGQLVDDGPDHFQVPQLFGPQWSI